MFFYSDVPEPYTGRITPYEKQQASKLYLKHYENYKFLRFMEERGNFQEKRQATKEILICERKLAYWQKHPNFDLKIVLEGRKVIDKKWSSSK